MVLKTFGALAHIAATRGSDMAAQVVQLTARRGRAFAEALPVSMNPPADPAGQLGPSIDDQNGERHDPSATDTLLADLGRLDGSIGGLARRIAATLADARAAIDEASCDLDDLRETVAKVSTADS